MHFFNLITTAGVATSAMAQIPPSSFGFPSAANELIVQYQSSNVTPGIHFGIGVPDLTPSVGYVTSTNSSDATGEYVLLMVDPDASTPENPTRRFILHWLQPNMTADSSGTLTNTTAAVAPYYHPAPPVTSNPHRYIQYLFDQPAGFVIPDSFSGFNAMNRTNFNLTSFISAAGLAAPVAANYFLCTNQTGIPSDFIAPPNGTYPSTETATMGAPISTGTNAPSSTGVAASSTSVAGMSATSATPASQTETGAAGIVGVSSFGLAVAAGVAALAM